MTCRFLKMGDPQKPIGFNTKKGSFITWMIWGIPISGKLHILVILILVILVIPILGIIAVLRGGFHSHGGTPIAGWFIS